MPDIGNPVKYPGLMKPWMLKENPQMPLYKASTILYYILNIYPYISRQIQFSAFIKRNFAL